MSLPLYQVNAFSEQSFDGNPAAICILDEAKSTQWMQSVAAQMNLSETAFLESKSDRYSLRWFTPTKEVDMCGHATLASAHCLWEQGYVDESESILFDTIGGELTASLRQGLIELNFPSNCATAVDKPEELVALLGIEPIFCGKFGEKYLFEVQTSQELLALNPDFGALKLLPERGVAITCKADQGSEYDFLSRYFAPWVGINEDPVNGSSHCALAPYWAARIEDRALVAYQASQRGGKLIVKVAGDRVKISGTARTILIGQLLA
ncbi:MAG: PhzF family phenazine biosynthesis isomerase [Oceanospirillaceae bacterium]